jgi:K+-transporting ATPase KdpF subunit
VIRRFVAPCLNLLSLMETILIGLLALALFAYLLVAMIRPELF